MCFLTHSNLEIHGPDTKDEAEETELNIANPQRHLSYSRIYMHLSLRVQMIVAVGASDSDGTNSYCMAFSEYEYCERKCANKDRVHYLLCSEYSHQGRCTTTQSAT